MHFASFQRQSGVSCPVRVCVNSKHTPKKRATARLWLAAEQLTIFIEKLVPPHARVGSFNFLQPARVPRRRYSLAIINKSILGHFSPKVSSSLLNQELRANNQKYSRQIHSSRWALWPMSGRFPLGGGNSQLIHTFPRFLPSIWQITFNVVLTALPACRRHLASNT